MRTFALTIAAVLGVSILSLGGPVAHAATQPKKEEKPAPVVVTVEPGDTLTAIAETTQSTVERVYSANTEVENPDLIHPGEKLRIPTADEQLTMRAMPVAVVAPAPAPVAATQPSYAPAAPTPAPQRVVQAAPVAGGSVWDQLAQCEAGGNWSINTGNGFYGGLQFTLSSWQAVGGSGYPNNASREEQIMRGQKLQALQGWGAWPACSAKLGLR